MGIALKVDSSFKLVILKFRLTSTNWNFEVSLQYLHPYLHLLIKILGFRCNIYTRTYLYQLEFWGFIIIPTPVLASTNWNFGASLQYMHMYLHLPIGISKPNCNTSTNWALGA
jgi:hypothetical protein